MEILLLRLYSFLRDKMPKKKSKDAWVVYMLECANQAFYTGITKDLDRRFKEHLRGGSRYTRYNPPKKIVHTEPYSTRSEAAKREARIKKMTREQKIKLLSTV